MFTNTYKELADIITAKVTACKWVDLWAEQPYFEAEEYPFPSPAVFIEFNASSIEDLPGGAQKIIAAVTFYSFFETTADTHKGSINQDSALAFGSYNDAIHAALHGISGTTFGTMNRVGFKKEPSPAYAHLYSQTYNTIIMDNNGIKIYDTQVIPGYTLTPGNPPDADDSPLFNFNL